MPQQANIAADFLYTHISAAINGNDIERIYCDQKLFLVTCCATSNNYALLRVKMTFVMQHHIAIIIISNRLSSILHDKNTRSKKGFVYLHKWAWTLVNLI